MLENDKIKAFNLLKTARGQLESAIGMLKEERYCIDVCKQLLAIRALLTKANNLVLHSHVEACVSDAIKGGEGAGKVDEIFELINRYSV